MRARRLAGPVAVVALVTGLAGCGLPGMPSHLPGLPAPHASSTGGSTAASTTSSPTSSPVATPSPTATTPAPLAASLLARTQKAMARAGSGRLTGTVHDDIRTLTISAVGSADASFSEGTYTDSTKTVDYRIVRSDVYFRGSDDFWTEAGATAAEAKTLVAQKKWLKIPVAVSADEVKDLSFAGLVVQTVDAWTKPDEARTKTVEDAKLGSTPCWRVADRYTAGTPVVLIAKDTLLPVSIDGDDGTYGEHLDISGWGSIARVSAPAPADVVQGSRTPPPTAGTTT